VFLFEKRKKLLTKERVLDSVETLLCRWSRCPSIGTIRLNSSSLVFEINIVSPRPSTCSAWKERTKQKRKSNWYIITSRKRVISLQSQLRLIFPGRPFLVVTWTCSYKNKSQNELVYRQEPSQYFKPEPPAPKLTNLPRRPTRFSMDYSIEPNLHPIHLYAMLKYGDCRDSKQEPLNNNVTHLAVAILTPEGDPNSSLGWASPPETRARGSGGRVLSNLWTETPSSSTPVESGMILEAEGLIGVPKLEVVVVWGMRKCSKPNPNQTGHSHSFTPPQRQW